MSQEWYVYKDGQQQGPYDWDQLWGQARSGTLQPSDYVWKEGMNDWTPASQIPGLVHGPAVVGPPPPSAISDGPPPPSAASLPRTAIRDARVPYPAAPPSGRPAWVWVAAILGAVVVAAAGCGAAYLLLFRDSGLLANRPGTTVLNPDGVIATAAVDVAEPEQPTAEPSAMAETATEPPAATPTETLVATEPTQPTPEPSATEAAATEPPPLPSPTAPTEADGQTLDPPSAVVDAFILATLGSLPGAAVDDDLARSLMTEGYASEFDSPEFVPLTYGIQQGPDSYEIASEEVFEPTATVLARGYWGSDLGRQWRFALVRENSVWRISGIDIQEEEPVPDDAPQSAFWELNPVATEFTVYGHGGWKLVVEFDDAPQDIDAQFRIEYLREDDGNLAYAQEDSGVIEAGRDRLTLDSDWTGYDLSQLGFEPGIHRVVAYIDAVEIAVGQLTVE